jgi:hypothetical protein
VSVRSQTDRNSVLKRLNLKQPGDDGSSGIVEIVLEGGEELQVGEDGLLRVACCCVPYAV